MTARPDGKKCGLRSAPRLYLYPVWRGKFLVRDISRIARLRGFKNQHLGFGVRQGAMLDATGDNAEFARLQGYRPIPKFNRDLTPPNEEQFILVVVMVPRKCSMKFHEFHFLPVEFGHHFRPPMLVNQRKLFIQ